MKALLEKVEAIDQLQEQLETLGVDLISHPDLKTESYEIKIALAYSTLQRVLRVPPEAVLAPVTPAVFNELEERLGDTPPEPAHEETAS